MNNNTQNITIITLCITAAILGGLVIGMSTDKAQASQCLATYGSDFVQIPFQLDHNTDMLVMIDARTHFMIAYKLNLSTGKIDVMGSADLDTAFKAD